MTAKERYLESIDGAAHQSAVEIMEELEAVIRELRKKIMEELEAAIRELRKYNRIHNDVESYLYNLASWALGEEEKKPNPVDYGLEHQSFSIKHRKDEKC